MTWVTRKECYFYPSGGVQALHNTATIKLSVSTKSLKIIPRFSKISVVREDRRRSAHAGL